jgi:predicted NUDIX family NTP pyrophosphohydrolase
MKTKKIRKSAGILLFKRERNQVLFFLVHHGGPFWQNKDIGAWSIPKGEYEEDEDPFINAKREFKEETGFEIEGDFLPLQPVKQKAGKIVTAWAIEGNVDPDKIVSNTYKMHWPPRSGKWIEVPEVDKAAWFETEEAKQKINLAQIAFIEELLSLIKLK